MRIAVLALQGAFIEHEQRLWRLGAETVEIRQRQDWSGSFDGLIVPGGESTVQARLLGDLRLLQPIREAIEGDLPVFGTCAGLILLAKQLMDNGEAAPVAEPSVRLATMDIGVCRNAYGRQLGSFRTVAPVKGIGSDVPMTFIRAPYIYNVWGNAEVLGSVDGRIVAARQGKQLVTAFHPELDDDDRVHLYFLEHLCGQR